MKNIRVVYGFASEKISVSIERSLRGLGFSVASTMKPTKQMLKDYIETHPEIDAVILKEYLDGGDKYSIKELCDLMDDVQVNVVAIISPSYRSKDAVKELYAAGIINAIFSDGKKGVDPDMIAKLAAYGRTRREARDYYRIEDAVIKKRYLTYDEQQEMYHYLADSSAGMNLIERFVTVSRWVSAEQLALFIKTLPGEALKALKTYKEFYTIYNDLARAGLVEAKLKVPKGVRTGLSPDNYRNGPVGMDEAPLPEQKGFYETVVHTEKDPYEEEELKGGAFYDYINNMESGSRDYGRVADTETDYSPPDEGYTDQDIGSDPGYESIEVSYVDGSTEEDADIPPGRDVADEASVDYSSIDVDSLIDMMG